jgi:uncharacterized protein (DUF433 family)
MDELVKNTAIVDGALVRAVTALMPGESIERILDATREVNLKRVFACIKARGYETIIHLVGDLHAGGLSKEDIKTLLTWTEDHEAKTLIESGLLSSVLKFVSKSEPSIHLKSGCLKWWSRNTRGKDP